MSEDEVGDLEENISIEEDLSMDEEDLVTKPKLMEENSSKDSFGESYYETSFSSDYISFLGTIDLGLGIGDCFWS